MLGWTKPDDADRLRHLNNSLADIRREMAAVESLLNKETPVVSLTLSPDKSPHLQVDRDSSSSDEPVLAHPDAPMHDQCEETIVTVMRDLTRRPPAVVGPDIT
jgi:hypothetical protein